MLTVTEIIDVAKVAQYLAANAVGRGAMFGQQPDPMLPLKIFTERKAVEWAYGQGLDYDGLVKSANYLFSICGKYGLIAQAVIGGGSSGGSTTTVGAGATAVFPIRLTSGDFEADGVTIIDSRLVGVNLMIFVNELNIYLQSGTGFTQNGDGIIMRTGEDATIGDFNATDNSYTLMVHRIY
jgi:hypothetical protein